MKTGTKNMQEKQIPHGFRRFRRFRRGRDPVDVIPGDERAPSDGAGDFVGRGRSWDGGEKGSRAGRGRRSGH